MRALWLLACTGMLALVAGGCQSSVADERDKLYLQNRELQARLKEMENRPATGGDAAAIKQYQDQLAAKDAEIQRLKDAKDTGGTAGTGTGGVPAGFEGMDASVDARGNVTVSLPGDVLFDSGKAEVKPTAKATLDKVVAALNSTYAGKEIRVQGHTDADPITRTKDTWTDNLDLSQARAANVTRYLIEKKVDPKRIATVGFGEHRPKGANKPANRRVEIVVVK